MTYKNFKVETDADGIAVVTWDIPGRSMNVLDETSIDEIEAIVKQTTEDAAIKGVVITSRKNPKPGTTAENAVGCGMMSRNSISSMSPGSAPLTKTGPVNG